MGARTVTLSLKPKINPDWYCFLAFWINKCNFFKNECNIALKILISYGQSIWAYNQISQILIAKKRLESKDFRHCNCICNIRQKCVKCQKKNKNGSQNEKGKYDYERQFY